jgi:hypothetical protein
MHSIAPGFSFVAQPNRALWPSPEATPCSPVEKKGEAP